MALCHIILDPSAAFDSVTALGEAELVQFENVSFNVKNKPLNEEVNPLLRKYTPQLKEIDQLEQRLGNLTKLLKENDIKPPPCNKKVESPTEKEIMGLNPGGMDNNDMDYLRKVTANAMEIASNFERIKENLELNIDCKSILQFALKLMSTGGGMHRNNSFTNLADEPKEGKTVYAPDDGIIHIIGGIILTSRAFTFEIIMSRLCRGNYILHTSHGTKTKNRQEPRTEFIILCHGMGVTNKIETLAKSFKAIILRLPNEKLKCVDLIRDCESQIRDIKRTLTLLMEHKMIVLKEAAKRHDCWRKKLAQAKAIYYVLNCMKSDTNKNIYIAKCWLPEADIDNLKQILKTSGWKGTIKPQVNETVTDEVPPTYFRQNKFTKAFQNIIDAYGVPSYREINPMPFTVVTFPFLFGVMFGDIGHGAIMFVLALLAIIYEKNLINANIESEVYITCKESARYPLSMFNETVEGDLIFTMIFAGRYIIILMGLFSIYAGIMYNDWFGKSLNFGSSWSTNYNKSTLLSNAMLQLNPEIDYSGTPYLIGIDPSLIMAENKIDFQNSLKMKASIIFGITQMTFGLVLNLINLIYFKSYLDIICEFIPKVLFFMFLFGYLVFLVFFKWFVYGPGKGPLNNSHCAPSVLVHFIAMMLFSPSQKNSKFADCKEYFFPYQTPIQRVLYVTAIFSIPWLLLLKPIILLSKRKPLKEGEKRKPEDGVLEVMVNSAIHSIEFALGCISYTASYLRLWALSLAHSQLSEVLWDMVFILGYKTSDNYGVSCFAVYFTFMLWSMATVSILVVMEGLSAFLHALRLHWMEFQSKYYAGAGYKFVPFSLKESQT